MKLSVIIPLLLIAHALTGQSPVRNGTDYAVFFYVTTFKNGLESLPETETECKALKAELEQNYGFKCELVPNPDRDAITNTLIRYNNLLGTNDQVLYFFSMHGYYDRTNDLGYLIASDGQPRSIDRYGKTYLKYIDLRPYFSDCRAKHMLVAIDACYSGSFADIRNKYVPDAPVYNKTDCISEVKKYFSYKGRQYVTSGNKDERTPAKSAFAAKFLETLRKDYNADKMIFFDDLAYKLSKAGSTNPENGTFTGHDPGSSFVFARKDACVNLSDRDSDGVSDDKDGCPDKWSSNPSGCPDDYKGGSNISADLAAWRRAKEQNSISAFNDYLIGFPNGEFREEAVLKLKDLEQEQKVRNDNSAWEVAVEKNNKEGYQKYLDKYPSGLHAAEARKRLEEPDKPDFMVFILGGTFNMGSENGDSDEKPVHRVTLSDFYLGKYEVTVAEFRVFVNDTGFKTDAEKGDGSYIYENGSWNEKSGINWQNDAEGKTAQDNLPVIHVSWNDAKAYCDWLSKKSGKTYRLPTEAEWEYGARGGKQSKGYEYAGSNDVGDVGWYSSNSGNKTHVVGEKLPNELGLYDMTGNVWEWCSDWKGDYPSGSQTNPTGPTSGSGRVMRGGSWYDLPQGCRVANRFISTPDNRSYNLGFRLARTK